MWQLGDGVRWPSLGRSLSFSTSRQLCHFRAHSVQVICKGEAVRDQAQQSTKRPALKAGDKKKHQHIKNTKKEKRDEGQRLAKIIAQAGFASRRKAEDLVSEGLVTVNGQVIRTPQHLVQPNADKVTVKGQVVPQRTKKYYFAVNKPKGYLCASVHSDRNANLHLVLDLLGVWLEKEWKPKNSHPQAVKPNFFTVGRLDVKTTGLVFVTNDGEWAQQIQHPSNEVSKEYIVTLERTPTRRQVELLAAGCEVDGAFVQPKTISFATHDRKDKIRVVVGEGRNREVRTMAEKAGMEVKSLKRVRVGGYRLPADLHLGEVRELKPWNVQRVTGK